MANLDAQRNDFTKGLDTDTDSAVVEAGTYRLSLNNRVISLNGNTIALHNIDGTIQREILPTGYFVIGAKSIDNIVFLFSHKPADTNNNIPAASEIGCYFVESLLKRKVIKRITLADGSSDEPASCSTVCADPSAIYYYLPQADLRSVALIPTLNDRGIIVDGDKDQYITLFNDSCNEEKLNFELNHKLGIEIDINFNDSYNIYWTDNLNVPKKFNTITNYQIPGANPDSSPSGNLFVPCSSIPCDEIDYCNPIPVDFELCEPQCLRFSVSLMNLVLPLKFPVIDSDYDQLVLPGGELLAGGYRACVRYITNDGNSTHWSYLSGLIEIVESSETTTNQNTYVGSDSDKITNKKFRLRIKNLDNRYLYMQMGVVHYTSDVAAVGFLMKKVAITIAEININNGEGEKVMECDGKFDGTFDINELIIEKIYLDRTKTIAQVDNIMFHGNITEVNIHNPCFLEIAKNIIVEFVIDDPIRKDEPYDKPLGTGGRGGYKNPDNVFKRTGYWRKQKYGFYIQFVLNNGKKSLLYPVGDVCADPDLLFETFGYNTNANGSPVADESIIGRDYVPMGVNDIIINYTRARFTNIDLTSVQNEIQGYAIFRSDRQGEVAIAEGLVSITPSYNPQDIKNDKDDPNRFAPTKDATWRIMNMPPCGSFPIAKRELFYETKVFKPIPSADTDDCAWNVPCNLPGDYVKHVTDDNDLDEIRTLSLFVPEAHISLKTLQTVKGAKIEFRYDIDKDVTFDAPLDIAENGCDNIDQETFANGCLPIIYSGHTIKRYYHRFNDWRKKTVLNAGDMVFTIDEAKYMDYDDLNTYIIYGAAYKNVAPTAWAITLATAATCLLFTRKTDDNYRKSWYCRTGSNILIHPETWVPPTLLDPIKPNLLDPEATGLLANDLPLSIAAYLVDMGIRAPEDRKVFFTNLYRPIDLNNLIDDTYVTGGDCYIVEAFMPIAVQTQTGNSDKDDTNLGVYAGFHLESESNLDLRYRPIEPQQSTLGDDTMIPLDYLSWNAFTGKDREDSRLYNKAHHALNKQNTGTVFTKDIIDPINFNLLENTRHLYSRIIYSNKKIIGEIFDPYREYFAKDFKDEQLNYGEIEKLIEIGGNLFVAMNNALLLEAINVPKLVNAGLGDLQLTSGDLFISQPKIITIEYGTRHAWSVVRSHSSVYGYDYSKRAIWQYSDTFHLLSKEKKINSLLNDISLFSNSQEETFLIEKHTVNDIIQVVFAYDYLYNELYCSFLMNNIGIEEVKSQTLIYSEDTQRFIGNFFDTPQSPNIQDDINPYIYFNIGNRFYAFNRRTSNSLHELNINGQNGLFFDRISIPSKLKYTVNKHPDKTKIFNNIVAYFNGYDKTSIPKYNELVFFNEIEVTNEYQTTGLIPIVPNVNAVVKERKWYMAIPREDINVLQKYEPRMRDRYFEIYFSFIPDAVGNNSYELLFIDNKFTISLR